MVHLTDYTFDNFVEVNCARVRVRVGQGGALWRLPYIPVIWCCNLLSDQGKGAGGFPRAVVWGLHCHETEICGRLQEGKRGR